MNRRNGALEVRGDGQRRGANSSLAGLSVLDDVVVGVKHLVGLFDRHREREPVASVSGSLRGDTVRREPLVDRRGDLRSRTDVLIDLLACMRTRRWIYLNTHLLLRKVFAVRRAARSGNSVELLLKSFYVRVLEGDAELDEFRRASLANALKAIGKGGD